MHPFLHQQLAKQHMEELRREALAMQRAHQSTKGLAKTSTRVKPLLWYLLSGHYLPPAELHEIQSSQLRARWLSLMRLVVLTAIALGLLLGMFLTSHFGPTIPTLLVSILVFAITLPMMVRTASLLRKGRRRLRPQA